LATNKSGLWLPAIILLFTSLLSTPAFADITYRSGPFAFHVPLELGPAKVKIGRIIRGGLGLEFQKWNDRPCYRMAKSSAGGDVTTLAALLRMFKERADVAVVECTSSNGPGITYVLTDGGLEAAADREVSRLRATVDPGTTSIMYTETLDAACAGLSVARRSDGITTEGTILLDVRQDMTRRNFCLYSMTVHLLGLGDEEYDFADASVLQAPGAAEKISLELDLLALFVLTHADGLAPDDATDRTVQINRVLTLMYIEGQNH
jgi:hypothetical protein